MASIEIIHVGDDGTKNIGSIDLNTKGQKNMSTESKLTKHQMKRLSRIATINGITCRVYCEIRHDDRCGNGHNTFSITGEVYEPRDRSGNPSTCGCIHDIISKVFPEVSGLIKWHLVSTDGPLHYVANTVYWVKNGNLEHARSSAVWPEATDEELTAPGLEERLKKRLPVILEEFKAAVQLIGFEY